MPAGWTTWAIWQHTDRGRIEGVSAPVDMNRFNGSLDRLRSFAAPEAAPVTAA
jgi:GH25 family lysozyme M1 (1,4-beta-N-acetylmuramidase)